MVIKKTMKEIEEIYDFEIDRIVKNIQAREAEKVLLQFPDGLKMYAITVVDGLSEKLPKVKFRISLDSCFGACDIPQTECDLVVQFGHAEWK